MEEQQDRNLENQLNQLNRHYNRFLRLFEARRYSRSFDVLGEGTGIDENELRGLGIEMLNREPRSDYYYSPFLERWPNYLLLSLIPYREEYNLYEYIANTPQQVSPRTISDLERLRDRRNTYRTLTTFFERCMDASLYLSNYYRHRNANLRRLRESILAAPRELTLTNVNELRHLRYLSTSIERIITEIEKNAKI